MKDQCAVSSGDGVVEVGKNKWVGHAGAEIVAVADGVDILDGAGVLVVVVPGKRAYDTGNAGVYKFIEVVGQASGVHKVGGDRCGGCGGHCIQSTGRRCEFGRCVRHCRGSGAVVSADISMIWLTHSVDVVVAVATMVEMTVIGERVVVAMIVVEGVARDRQEQAIDSALDA